MDAEFALLHPYWLLFLPFPWLWWHRRRHQPRAWPQLIPAVAIRYPPLGHLPAPHANTTLPAGAPQADRLTAFAMVLALFALAQPVQYTTPVEAEQSSEPVDLVLVIGTSITMSLRDYVIDGQHVDRMSLSKKLLDDFVTQYSGNRIGLVILGNPPALWLPLTADKNAVRDAIGRIRTTLGGRLTDMGATLQLIHDHFPAPRETVVLVISDGALQLGAVSPQEAAQDLAAAGFTLYVAAIGSTDPDAIGPVSGQLIYQPVDLVWLQRLAEIGGGQMVHASDAQTLVDTLQAIESRHRHPVPASSSERLVRTWYPAPLALSMLLLVFAAFRQPETSTNQAREGA